MSEGNSIKSDEDELGDDQLDAGWQEVGEPAPRDAVVAEPDAEPETPGEWDEAEHGVKGHAVSPALAPDDPAFRFDTRALADATTELVAAQDAADFGRSLLVQAGAVSSAERAAFIVRQGSELVVAAIHEIGLAEPRVGIREPLSTTGKLCAAIVQQAVDSATPIVLGHAPTGPGLANDPYLIGHHVRSVYCAPLGDQGRVVALVYLENNQVSDAFVPARVHALGQLLRVASTLVGAKLAPTESPAGTMVSAPPSPIAATPAPRSVPPDEATVRAARLAATLPREVASTLAKATAEVGALRAQLKAMLGELEAEVQVVDAIKRPGFRRAVGAVWGACDTLEQAVSGIGQRLGVLRGLVPVAPGELAPVVVSELIEETVTKAAPLLGTSIRVQLNVDPRLTLRAVRADVAAALLHLVQNAAHSIGAAGTIRLTAAAEGDWGRLEIEDDGCGMPAALVDALGRNELAAPPDQSYEVGVGLRLACAVAWRHRGTVQFERRVDRTGTRVVLRLPLDPSAIG